MPLIMVDGIKVSYAEHGSGEPVLLIMGSGSPGDVWELFQVPALVAAGFRCITFDNPGMRPESEEVAEIDDVVAVAAGLIRYLCGGRAMLVGTSMGAHAVQELLVSHPEMVTKAVLMATRGRPDAFRAAMAEAEAQMYMAPAQPPARYLAVVRALQALSPHSLNDEESARTWLELLELFPVPLDVLRAQHRLECMANRLHAYRAIRTPCMVVAFADDVLTPPGLGREVAEAIGGSRYELVERCGHYGYLERPDEINALLIDFLRES